MFGMDLIYYEYPTTEALSIVLRAPNESILLMKKNKEQQLEEKHSTDTLEMPIIFMLISGSRDTSIIFSKLQVTTTHISLGTIEIAPMMITM